MTTITKERIELFIKNPLDNGLTRGEQMELARIALASLEAEPVAYIFKHPAGKLFWALTDESNKEQADVIPVYAAPPVPVVSEEKPMPNPLKMYAVDDVAAIAEVRGWNAYRAAMLQSQGEGNPHVTPARLPGGFTIEDAKVLHEDLVRSHISQALSGEKMKKKDRDADLRWIHGVIVQAAWFVKASLEQNALSGNSPVIPGEVLSAIREVARIRADFDDFDGDRRGIGDCLDEAEQELIVTINKYASQLAAEPIAPNDVREQTAIPQVPVTPDSWISCSEQMPEKNQNVLISVNFDSDLVEPLICSARYTGSTFRRGEATIKPGNGIEQATHWMPLPEPPQEVNRG